jgi:hypothetical protein
VTGHIAGAGIGVTAEERLMPSSPLWAMEQVLITPTPPARHGATKTRDRDPARQSGASLARRTAIAQPDCLKLPHRQRFPSGGSADTYPNFVCDTICYPVIQKRVSPSTQSYPILLNELLGSLVGRGCGLASLTLSISRNQRSAVIGSSKIPSGASALAKLPGRPPGRAIGRRIPRLRWFTCWSADHSATGHVLASRDES